MLKRNNRVFVRLNDNELSDLQNKVLRCGLSREEFIRRVIAEKEIKELPCKDFYDTVYNLRMIGNNISQIAKKANALNLIDAPEYKRNYKELQVIVGRLFEVMF